MTEGTSTTSEAATGPAPARPGGRRLTVRRRLLAAVDVPALLEGGMGTARLLGTGDPVAPAAAAPGAAAARHAGPDLPSTVSDLPDVADAAWSAPAPAPESGAASLTTRRATTLSAADVHAALARRTAALRARNEKAFLATFDASRTGLIATERILFRNLVKLPLVAPVYKELAAGGTTTARRYYVSLVHQIQGADVEAGSLTKLETWVRRSGAVVTTTVAAVPGQPGTRYAPLDQVSLNVRNGRLVTVVGTADVTDLAAVDAAAEEAAGAVHGVWGSRPGPTRFIVFATHDKKAIGSWFGANGAPAEAIAATMPQIAYNHRTRFSGARVVIDLSQVPAGEVYRVLRHEFTHAIDIRVQTVPRGNAVQNFPIWTEEGFAAWVEELDQPTSASLYAQDLRRLRSLWNHALPPDGRSAFYAPGDRGGFNYDLAVMIYRYVAEHDGDDTAIAFYTYLAGGGTDPYGQVLHTDRAAFTRAWSAYVDGLLAA